MQNQQILQIHYKDTKYFDSFDIFEDKNIQKTSENDQNIK